VLLSSAVCPQGRHSLGATPGTLVLGEASRDGCLEMVPRSQWLGVDPLAVTPSEERTEDTLSNDVRPGPSAGRNASLRPGARCPEPSGDPLPIDRWAIDGRSVGDRWQRQLIRPTGGRWTLLAALAEGQQHRWRGHTAERRPGRRCGATISPACRADDRSDRCCAAGSRPTGWAQAPQPPGGPGRTNGG